MNANKITKALECCVTSKCGDCPIFYNDEARRVPGLCIATLEKNALDLINSLQAEKEALIAGQETMSKYIEEQQAEIERLQESIELMKGAKCVYSYDGETLEYCTASPCPVYKTAEQIKSEAIKEFAERLCEGRVLNDPVVIAVKAELKEMLGDTENRIKPEYHDGDPDCPICPNCRTPLNEMEDCDCGAKIDWSEE